MDIFKTEADEKIAELTAQVEMLKSAIEVYLESGFGEILECALDETPAQALTEIGRVTDSGVVWNKNGNPHQQPKGSIIYVLRTTNKSGGGDE